MQYLPRTLTAIATASLLAAFAAHANKGAEYQPKHHKEHHKNFFITGGATYLEPSNDGLFYATITETALTSPATTTAGKAYFVQPDFDWGYFIQAGYRISHHYDIEASWAQYNSSLSHSVSGAGDSGVFISQLLTSNLAALLSDGASNALTASTNQSIDYSIFDANLGQYHDITEMLRARVFAGIRYAKIDADTDNTYTETLGNLTFVENYDSSFNGWGPEVGMDLEYTVWHTLGVVGHFGAALLIGNLDVSSDIYDTNADRQLPIKQESYVRLVPGVDAKLGANWNVPYAYEKCSFGIEAGYQIAYYWDVIDQIQFPDTLNGTVNHNDSNYGNMGPYLNFTAMF